MRLCRRHTGWDAGKGHGRHTTRGSLSQAATSKEAETDVILRAFDSPSAFTTVSLSSNRRGST